MPPRRALAPSHHYDFVRLEDQGAAVTSQAMVRPFTFLSFVEFYRLDPQEKLLYLTAGMAELERARRGGRDFRSDDLFIQPRPQQEETPKT